MRLIIYLVLLKLTVSHAAKILMIFNAVSKSHYILGEALGKGLAEKGHQVTMISPFKTNVMLPNYNEIVLDELIEISKGTIFGNIYKSRRLSGMQIMQQAYTAGVLLANATLYHHKVSKLVNSNETFDAVIMQMLMNECFNGMALHFNAIPILLSTVGSSYWTDLYTGNPRNPAYNHDILFPFSNPMKYHERLVNTLLTVMYQMAAWYQTSHQHELYESYFRPIYRAAQSEFPHLSEITHNYSLVLLNENIAIGEPRAMVPNMINVGGMHIKEQILPQNLKEILDKSLQGAIYFSLGGNVNSTELSEPVKIAIIKTFSNLNLTVLWKWEDDSLPNRTDNIITGKWMPQQAILGHPNVKIFMTHGGLLSTSEAIYFGVPILGIPISGDQPMNVKRAEKAGYGIRLELDDITEETLTAALTRLLHDSSYRTRAKQLSIIFRDEPQHPLDKAVAGVEYVLRHNGARFLRSPAVHMPFYQILLIDVFLGITFIVIMPILITYWLIRKVFILLKRYICKSGNKKKKE